MRKISAVALSAALLALGFAGTADATLISRLGGQAYYDTVLKVTWLKNANYAATELSDARVSQIISDVGSVDGHTLTTSDFVKSNSGYTGQMTWWGAVAWAQDLNFGGFTGWRLPTMMDPGGLGCTGGVSYSGQTCGYNVPTTSGSTVYSEMASLFYDTLGNLAYCNSSGGCPQSGWSLASLNAGPFTNLYPNHDHYWTMVPYAPNPTVDSWYFNFISGVQNANDNDGQFYAWAVHPGDIGTPVPEPDTAWLMSAGLLGLLGIRRRSRRT